MIPDRLTRSLPLIVIIKRFILDAQGRSHLTIAHLQSFGLIVPILIYVSNANPNPFEHVKKSDHFFLVPELGRLVSFTLRFLKCNRPGL